MLTKVEISNFLTIEKISFSTDSNIVAIVGESGAGKSLILKAIESVFSQKAPTNIVGKFSDTSFIKLFFRLNEEQRKILAKFGMDEEEIVVEKIIKPKKTKAFINHEPVSARVLSEIKNMLLNIVSQNYRFRFFESENILSVLDRLVDKKVKDEFDNIYESFLDISAKKRTIEEKIHSIDQKHPEILLEAIEKTDPKKDEYEHLLDKLKKIKSISFAREKSFEIIDKLYENDNSVETTITEVSHIFEKLESIGFDTTKLTETLNNILEYLSDIKPDIYNMQQDTPKDDIDNIESRLFELEQLQRKFNKQINEIVKEKEELKSLIEQKGELVFELEKTEKEMKEKSSLLLEKAESLSKARISAKEKMEKKIYEFLKDMMLENSLVRFEFTEKKIDKTGKDLVDIVFSANPDIGADKIEKIASGGERSRFILAMEAANSQIKENLETLILDEIEAGISEKTLEKTADVIKKLSKKNQIILITHNEHLSKIADTLFRIEKTFDGHITRSFIEQIK